MPRRPRRPVWIALAAALGVLVLLIGAWAVDAAASNDGSVRNVSLDGTPVGGLSETDVRDVVDQLAQDTAARPVHLEAPTGSLDTTAGDLGLSVDQEATVRAVLDAGRGTWPARPITWLGSIVSAHQVQVVYDVDTAATQSTMAPLADANHQDPTEPTLLLADGVIAPIGGKPGAGIDQDALTHTLVDQARGTQGPISITVDVVPIDPSFSDADVQQVADQANQLAADQLTVNVAGKSTTIGADTLLTWMRAVPDADGAHLVLGMDQDQVSKDVGKAVGVVGTPPTQLTWNVDGAGHVSYTAGSAGTGCCAPDSPQRVVDALRAGQSSVELDLTTVQPDHDAAWADSMGITQVVSSFTTHHAAGQPRVTNIHRFADIIRGAVIEPGQTFSLNAYVGQRTVAKGFVEAPVIYNGKDAEDVGGGVSQFATTTFNAAFFAGLEYEEYQSHSLYISRYPYGREATISWEKPDLKIKNNTPYGILIWPTYTASSITVTFYSTPWITADQTGQSEAPSGVCTRVTTERTRTWLSDGHQEVDHVYALYQPREGVLC